MSSLMPRRGAASLAKAGAASSSYDALTGKVDDAFCLEMLFRAMGANLEPQMPLVPNLPESSMLSFLDTHIEKCPEAHAEKAAGTWEGHCAPEQLLFLRHFVASRASAQGRPLRMCQVGFNAGHSAAALLEHAPARSVLMSLDMVTHSYTKPLERLVQAMAAERGSTHFLLAGDSADMLPKFHSVVFDLVFIDGNHAYEAVALDLANFLVSSSSDTDLLVNHVFTEMREGQGPTRAWLDAVCRGDVEQRAWHSCCSRHGIIVGRSRAVAGHHEPRQRRDGVPHWR